MEKVARGTTIGIVKIVPELLEWIRQIRTMVSGKFTGRLEGILKKDSGEVEFVLEVRNGRIIGVWFKDTNGNMFKGAGALDKIFHYLREAQEGYIEIVELEESGVELDIEYNKDIVIDKEVTIDDFIDSLVENRKLWELGKILEGEEDQVAITAVKEEVEEKRFVEEKEEEITESEEYREIIEKIISEQRIEALSESEKEYAKKILGNLSSESKPIGKGEDRLFNVINLVLALSKQYERPLLLLSRVNDETFVLLAENGKIRGIYRIDELSLQILESGARALKRLASFGRVPYTIYEVEVGKEGMFKGFKRLLKKLFGGK